MGYALRRSRLLVWSWQLCRGMSGNFAWNRRQLCCGISGSFYAESVATFGWNRWQLSRGIRTSPSPPGTSGISPGIYLFEALYKNTQNVAATNASDGRGADRSRLDAARGAVIPCAALAAASRGVSKPSGGKPPEEVACAGVVRPHSRLRGRHQE